MVDDEDLNLGDEVVWQWKWLRYNAVEASDQTGDKRGTGSRMTISLCLLTGKMVIFVSSYVRRRTWL